MARGKYKNSEPDIISPPALTVEGREDQLISLAISLAEKKLRDGTATNQMILHYLKLGSTKERLEKEKLERENELLVAKVQAIESASRIEELYAGAIRAMKEYKGEEGNDFDDQNVR